jgi:hypothetical protein
MRLSCDWKIAAIDCISALSLLTELDLNSNYGTGTIPSQLSTLSLLRYLGTNQNWVGNNQLSALIWDRRTRVECSRRACL